MPRGKWQLKDGLTGRVYFPLTITRIRRWVREGRAQGDDKVWRPGFPEWKKIEEVEEFEGCLEEVSNKNKNFSRG